jgi:DNA-binding CsgD family transcriptional regulator
MSSVNTVPERPTELRLDYRDLVAGQLVIVIDGLPTTDRIPVAVGPRTASATGSNGNRDDRPSSPLSDEAVSVGEAIGDVPTLFTPLLLAAWRSREALATELVDAAIEEAPPDDVERVTALTHYAKAVLCNGLGRYEDALVAAQRACAHADLGLRGRAQVELVEAGARSDARDLAADALRSLERRTRTGTDWALAVWARSAALLSDSAAAETLYREAVERLDRDGAAVHLARARLVYGEWLRRENRRVDAREQLRAAHETFDDLGAEAFAERARRELLATGETARRRTDDTRSLLTPQEAQIARLAQDGLSNPEIGAQLFISPRTVQYHLRKVFLKLEITSRNQLARLPVGSLQPT